jgi:hypothetical protein
LRVPLVCLIVHRSNHLGYSSANSQTCGRKQLEQVGVCYGRSCGWQLLSRKQSSDCPQAALSMLLCLGRRGIGPEVWMWPPELNSEGHRSVKSWLKVCLGPIILAHEFSQRKERVNSLGTPCQYSTDRCFASAVLFVSMRGIRQLAFYYAPAALQTAALRPVAVALA